MKLGTLGLLALLCGTWVNACAGSKITTTVEYDPLYQFQLLKTYDFMPGDKMRVNDSKVNNEFLDAKVRENITRVLEQKGFQRLTGSTLPDFWVAYSGLLEDDEEVHHYIPIDMEQLVSNEKAIQESYKPIKKGTLILDVIEPKTRRQIWHGTAQTKVDLKSNWKEKEERIKLAVESTLKKEFPPSY